MILISPYAAALQNGNLNPKNYPFWNELLTKIGGTKHIVQVGVDGEEKLVPDFRKNLSVAELRQLLKQCETVISCDSFMQHLAWDEGVKAIVLWSVSDPLIYGHPEHINLLKSREYLVENQFLWWNNVQHNSDSFVKPDIVMEHLHQIIPGLNTYGEHFRN